MDTESSQNAINDITRTSETPIQPDDRPGEAPAGQAPQIVDSPSPVIADPLSDRRWPAAATPVAVHWNWHHTVTLGLVIAGIGLIGGRARG